MKKIMIALIAGAMGVAAQAASVTWKVTGVYGYNDPGGYKDHFYDNYRAYLIDTAVFTDQITASNYRDAIAKATASAGLSRINTYVRAKIADQTLDIGYGVGEGAFVTLVIDNTLGQETSFVVSDQTNPLKVSDKNILSFSFSSITYNKEWTPAGVPEPSSAAAKMSDLPENVAVAPSATEIALRNIFVQTGSEPTSSHLYMRCPWR